MTRQVLTEATQTTTATPVEGQPGRFLVQLINPGWGSSGYYSASVLEAAAKNRVFPKGTHMYLDHPTASEQYERPERSVRDLAAVLAEDASYVDGALVAEAQVFGPYRDVLAQMADSIGVSIRAAAEVTEGGEAEGKRGRIIDALVEGLSADYVTHAGRGGKILQVLESARPVVDRSGVDEATANDTRELLDAALKDAFGGEKQWVGVRDFDASTVWFWWSTPDSEGVYQVGYSLDADGVVTLTGTPVEVRAVTTYVPVNPAGQSTTQESEEDPMATTQIEESDLARLREDAGRVPTLESERDTARQERDAALAERDEAREALAARDRDATVARIVGEAAEAAGVQLNEFETAGIASRHVLAQDGTVDEAATRTAFDNAIASLAEANGVGRVRGMGGKVPAPTTGDAVSEADFDALDDAVFGQIKEA